MSAWVWVLAGIAVLALLAIPVGTHLLRRRIQFHEKAIEDSVNAELDAELPGVMGWDDE